MIVEKEFFVFSIHFLVFNRWVGMVLCFYGMGWVALVLLSRGKGGCVRGNEEIAAKALHVISS